MVCLARTWKKASRMPAARALLALECAELAVAEISSWYQPVRLKEGVYLDGGAGSRQGGTWHAAHASLSTGAVTHALRAWGCSLQTRRPPGGNCPQPRPTHVSLASRTDLAHATAAALRVMVPSTTVSASESLSNLTMVASRGGVWTRWLGWKATMRASARRAARHNQRVRNVEAPEPQLDTRVIWFIIYDGEHEPAMQHVPRNHWLACILLLRRRARHTGLRSQV
jgi:hypothetical protein